MHALVIGGSKNIGYYSAVRFLDAGNTVTFLLRNPTVFDNDEKIKSYVASNKAFLIQGDALVREDVKRVWEAAAANSPSGNVDILLFTLGGTPKFHIIKGFVISPPNLVTQSLLNTLSTMPTPPPKKIIAISSTGLTPASHSALPLPLKPFYSYLLPVPHRDKLGAERIIAHLGGWTWDSKRDGEPDDNILDRAGKWKEGLPQAASLSDNVLVVRPALLTDGECQAEKEGVKSPYRVSEGELAGYTVSRKDVAHFVSEVMLGKKWDEWKGKRATIVY